eukprot:2702518-Prymnesium_polylepis.1
MSSTVRRSSRSSSSSGAASRCAARPSLSYGRLPFVWTPPFRMDASLSCGRLPFVWTPPFRVGVWNLRTWRPAPARAHVVGGCPNTARRAARLHRARAAAAPKLLRCGRAAQAAAQPLAAAAAGDAPVQAARGRRLPHPGEPTAQGPRGVRHAGGGVVGRARAKRVLSSTPGASCFVRHRPWDDPWFARYFCERMPHQVGPSATMSTRDTEADGARRRVTR